MRAWARAQGIAVAERGRVPAQVHAAYHASTAGKPAVRKAAAGEPARKASANARATKAPARKTPARKAPVSRAPVSRAPVSRAPATASPVPARKAPAASTGMSSAAGPEVSMIVTAPSAAPVPPVDDRRLERLQEQVLALTARVAELEKPQAPKSALFRRKRG